MVWVRRHRNVGWLRQLSDIVRLKLCGIGANTYFTYALFDRQRVSGFAAQRTFRDFTVSLDFLHFTDRRLLGVGYHKHLFYRLMASFGFPVPEIRAMYCPVPDGFERHHAMQRPDELARFLRETALPLFGKPSQGSHGEGCRSICERLPNGLFRMGDDSTATLDGLVGALHEIALAKGTYLLLERLAPRADIQALSGEALASLRIVTLVRAGVPELVRAVILLPTAHRYISNWNQGSEQSLCGAIDLETGRIHDVLCSLGPDLRHAESHPITGARVDGHVIGGWSEVVELVLRASLAMAPVRLQHWDVALTTRGPVLLELNINGDAIPLQMHGPPGILTEQYVSFAATHRVW